MTIFNKFEELKKTPLLQYLITVDIYEDVAYLLDGKPIKKYLKSIGFYNEKDFEEFKRQNNLK